MKSFCFRCLITLLFFIPYNLFATETIFEYKTRNQINVQDLIAAIHDADIILLGEIHDNLFQHRARADIISKIQAKEFTIVSEHLVFGSEIIYSGRLLEDLETIGFNKKAWNWPVHEVLYKKFEELSLPVFGGNLSEKDINSIYAKRGFSQLDTLTPIVNRSTLDSQSKDKLINVKIDEKE